MMELPFLQHVKLPIRLHVVSKTPGRIRLRVAPEYRQDSTMAEIANALKTFVTSIEKVHTNAQTGSITISFRGETKQLEDAFSNLSQFGVILNDIPIAESTASDKVTAAMAGLNQRVKLATEGSLDLRFLFPLLLALLAVRQMVSKSPRLNTAPWYVLAWYAFDSFMKLNAPQQDTVMQTEGQALNSQKPVRNQPRRRQAAQVKS
jgi:hypothetical protein